MSEMDKKMEEFFRRSMDQFNDSPSVNVWDQLSDQLDEDETFFTKSKRWIKSKLPLLILLLGFGALSVFSFQSINELKFNNVQLLSENQNYKISVSELSNENNLLAATTNDLRSQLKDQKALTKQIEDEIQQSKKTINKSFYGNAALQEKLRFSEALNITYKNQLDACANDLSAMSLAGLNGIDDRQNSNPINTPRNQSSNISTNQTADIPRNSSSDPSRNGIQLSIATLSKWIGLGLEFVDEKSSSIKWSPAQFNKNLLSVDPDKEVKTKMFRYRYGLTGRAYNTFVQNGFDANFSNSYGLVHELSFKDKWSITNSLEYNDQEYIIDSETGSLEPAVVSRYPDNPGDLANVRSVKSRSKYFDTQVGVKYQRPNKKGNGYYFVNPSVVWQLYLPQEFSFDLIQAQDLLVERRGYVGYLGSVNLQVGIERKLTKRMDFQMALFAERSLIELGHDNQIISLIGLRSSVLFGK